ncbi:unnamed protein product [Prorocentrum cordatum]|uniref:Uncharacterized protein n=1 Tax=Prorocentrum cordatum TaxID=2364126 RepID=A0ABN9VQ12_9DINO|nr:unnamed protein product [Polarella glacialis]
MCHPLFAGWDHAGTFARLVGQDTARLQQHLGHERLAQGRRDLADPEACVHQLAAMLLQAPGGLSGRSGRPAVQPQDGLKSELAERAARLEVLLALLAEVVAPQAVAAGTSCAAVADARGCPSTRIGWVEAVLAALKPATAGRAGTASKEPPLPLPRERSASASRAVGVQTLQMPAAQTPAVRLREASTQAGGVWATRVAATQARLSPASAAVGCQAGGRGEAQDASTETEPTTGEGILRRPASSDAAAQASPSSAHTGSQASAEAEAAGTQTSATASQPAWAQTDPPPALAESAAQTEAAQPPRPGGLRDRRLGAEGAAARLDDALERLALEREAAAALEGRLGEAGRSLQGLRRENAGLRRAAAEAAEAARAAAAAAERPPSAEAATQAGVRTACAEVQTEPNVYNSHTWQQPRPERGAGAPRGPLGSP